jgi:hypothetical protein
MRLLIISLVICSSIGAHCQNILTDNINWTVDNLLDSASNATMAFNSQFKVYPGQQKIEWIQDGGSYVSTFTITSVSSQWADINQNGAIEYDATYQGKAGLVRIERGSDFFHIKLFFMESNKNLLPFTFHVANFSAL